jgi:hypothetical protein
VLGVSKYIFNFYKKFFNYPSIKLFLDLIETPIPFQPSKQIPHSPYCPYLLAGIFYWPDTHNKKGAIWI